MSPITLGLRGLGVGRDSYFKRILAAGPIAYWPLWEQAGSDAHCLVNPAQNGTAVGVTWADTLGPDGVNGAPFFDGTNDYVNVLTAALTAAFPANVGTLAIWARVLNAGVWTDGVVRYGAAFIDATDFNEQVGPWKDSVNNRFWYTYRSGGVTKQVTQDGIATTDWYHAAITWSNVANEMRAFYNGAQIGAPLAGLGAWAGAITRAVIGAPNTTPTFVWHGWLAHCALWNRAKTPAEIADLATA